MGWFSSSAALLLLLLVTSSLAVAVDHPNNPPSLSRVDIERPVLDLTPSLRWSHSDTHGGAKGTLLCERVRVSGISRLKLGSYASSFHVSLAPSAAIPERLHRKIHVCFHRNNSRGWCECEKDEWRSVQKGIWSAVKSPYETGYVDVRINGQIAGSVTVALEEDFQQWRLICLTLGFALLWLAPIVSSRVPFYYSSSTGRKNIFYLTIYGSMLGVGSFLLHEFPRPVNSILQSLGMSEEMHNPVAVCVLLGIILAGAALGYWIVRRFVISKDGTVDPGVAQFVKRAMHIIGIITFIFQITIDPPLAIGALLFCGAVGVMLLSSTVAPQSSQVQIRQDYYSTFHKIRNRKKFTKEEWDEFTRQSTRQALAELAASPKFTDWIIEHPHRKKLLPSESSDETMGSESDTTEVGSGTTEVGCGTGFRLFNWQ